MISNDQATPGSKLTSARRAATCINVAGGIAASSSLFYTGPYDVVLILTMLFPIGAIIVMVLHPGLITLHERRKSEYPTVMYAVLLPGVFLLAIALRDFNLAPSNVMWYYTVGFAAVYLAVMREVKRTAESIPIMNIIGASAIAMAYSYGTYVIINCKYDVSAPSIHRVTIVDKKIDEAKSTSYYLVLEQWGPFTSTEESRVPKEKFDSVNTGDVLNIALKPGPLQTQWYYIKGD